MTPRPSAVRVGLFAIGGLALLIAAVALLVGGRIFADVERALLVFPGSVQGLQVGAPVVMRGVRLGHVRSIALVNNGADFSVPVVIEVELGKIREATGTSETALSIGKLTQRGLTARLAAQSLLTGQQFIDLDMRLPDAAPIAAAAATAAAAAAAVAVPKEGALPQIPTQPAALSALQAQLGKLDLVGLMDDARSTLAAARKLAGGPEIRQTLAELAGASSALARLSGTLERRAPGLVDRAETTLASAGQAAGQIGSAAGQFSDAAGRLGAAAGRAESLLSNDSPTLASVRKATDELARSAAALRESSAGESPTVQQLQQSLAEVSRAARAVRQLAELLDQQPEVLIRGRAETK